MIDYSITINGITRNCEVGAEITLDGTETFDSGTFEYKNSLLSNPFTEADDVVLTVGTKSFAMIIQADRVTKVNSTRYDHTVTLTEETAKLTKSYSVDRFFTLNGTSLFTHQQILDRVRTTTPLGKTPLYTISSATQTALGTASPQKKFEGLNQFQVATDVMRGISSVPRLINGELSHTPYNEINNLITLGSLIGWQKDVDLNNYATAIISRAKNITYDLDLTTGATWWPSETKSATPRSTSGDYADENAQYQLGLDIRRVQQAFIINYEITGGTLIDMNISDYVFSKEAWDGLPLGSRNLSVLITEIGQRNTIYYDIGSNTIDNIGAEYKDNLGGTDYVMDSLIKSWLTNNGYLITDFKSYNLSELEMRIEYQPYLEANISAEKWGTSITKVSEILNNQKDTTLDIGRYGVVMDTVANRLSNGNWLIQVKHNDETEIWDLYDYTSDLYKVIKAKYQFYPNEIIGTYELSQYWATINGYQSVYKNTDPYTIGRDNVNSNYRYTEYLEISTENIIDDGSLTTIGRRTMMNIFDYTASDDNPINLGVLDSSEQTGYSIMMNVMSTGAKGLRFMTKFQEPKNAGNELITDAIGKASKGIPYTDETGYMESFEMKFTRLYTNTSVEDTYPKIVSPTIFSIVELPTLTIYKNPNEVFGLNYELIPCTAEEGLILYNTFSERNNLANDGELTGLNIYYSTSTTEYDIFDTVPKEVQSSVALSSATVSKLSGNIDISGLSTPANVTWAVGTSTYLILAVNYNGTTRDSIYINNLKERTTTESL